MDARRDIRRWNGLGRSGLRLLPSRHGRSRRALSAGPIADPRHPRGGRARARGRDAADAGDDRHARRPNVASATGLRSDCLRLLGHSATTSSCASSLVGPPPVRLGHSLSVAAAVVGAGARARLYRVTDDRVGHPRHPMARPHPGDSFHAGLVGCELGRHPARAGGIHGRFDSCPARRARHGSSGAADGVQLAGVRRGAPAHGHAVGAHRLVRHRLVDATARSARSSDVRRRSISSASP